MTLLVNKDFKKIYCILFLIILPILLYIDSWIYVFISSYYYSIVIYSFKCVLKEEDITMNTIYNLSILNAFWFWLITGILYGACFLINETLAVL